MTKYPDLFAALAAPFSPQEVKVRSHGNLKFHYITARTAMNRLDSVVGPENWWDHYIPLQNSVLCELTVRMPDGTTLTKSDAGGCGNTLEQIDDDKSRFSDAFKRAAVKFGVARYLYRDGTPEYSQEQASKIPERKDSSASDQKSNNSTGSPSKGMISEPKTGRALFAWVKQQEQEHEVGLLQYLNKWSKLHDYPGRMVDWDREQVMLAYQEALRKLQATQPDRAEALEEAIAN